MYASSRESENHLAAMRALVEAGANLDHQNREGTTALMMVASRLDHDAMQLLMDAGADLTLVNIKRANVVDIYNEVYAEKQRRNRGVALTGPDFRAKFEAAGVKSALENPPAKTQALAELPASLPATTIEVGAPEAPAPPSPEPAPVSGPCGTIAFTNLDADEQSALVYLLKRERNWDFSGKRYCVESLEATEKFEVRGDTVVRFKAMVYFPNGNRTECLGPASLDGMDGVIWSTKCGPFVSDPFKPVASGGWIAYDGELTL